MRILQVSTADKAGGAEAVAWQLFQAYRRRGHDSWLAVGLKQIDDHDVLIIPNDAYRNRWARTCIAVGNLLSPFIGKVRSVKRLRKLIQIGIGQPRRWWDIWQGKEDFDFPGTWRLLNLAPAQSNVVHCHNLHGAWIPSRGYFDLRALPWLSQQVPVVLTLHDEWLLSGYCTYTLDCGRWKAGCGHCPRPGIYLASRRDATAYNWQRKREIYADSQLYLATPSRWLMQRVEQSILVPAVMEARVIPNGVDQSIFHPAVDRRAVRAKLGISQGAVVLLFVATAIRRHVWKDYQTLRAAVTLVAERLHGQDLLFIALGEDAPAERIGQAEIRFVPYQKDPMAVARYYQAADIYVHAARADTFPNTVLEALACSTPVVATAVGGIPEQVKGLRILDLGFWNSDLNGYGMDEATGLLVPPGGAEAMATAIKRLLGDEMLRRHLGENAAKDARCRFHLERQVEAYLDWYQEIIEHRNVERSTC